MLIQEMQEMWVWSLGPEDPLEYEMVTHSSIPAYKNSIDRRAWQVTLHQVVKNQTGLREWARMQGSKTST